MAFRCGFPKHKKEHTFCLNPKPKTPALNLILAKIPKETLIQFRVLGGFEGGLGLRTGMSIFQASEGFGLRV